jgi:hypothetical protein
MHSMLICLTMLLLSWIQLRIFEPVTWTLSRHFSRKSSTHCSSTM